jgi:pyroglutamyl-peptidase
MKQTKKSGEMPIALVTGFDPFGGETINPSLEIARALDGEIVAGHRIVGAGLPTEFARSRRRTRGGFIHVPYLPEQARKFPGAASLPLDTMIRALRLCLDTALA